VTCHSTFRVFQPTIHQTHAKVDVDSFAHNNKAQSQTGFELIDTQSFHCSIKIIYNDLCWHQRCIARRCGWIHPKLLGRSDLGSEQGGLSIMGIVMHPHNISESIYSTSISISFRAQDNSEYIIYEVQCCICRGNRNNVWVAN
jgi:hypothetical protein